jgi:pSer/pThr/pTyr-binding forkhead associated (FHA) protein
MADLVPVLIGTAGLVEGECFLLDTGIDLIVGRSRSCDISLRRTTAYLKTPAAVRDGDHDFNTVSRRHLRVQVSGGNASLQDLSTNGTFFNGEPMREQQQVDLNAGSCTVRLGTRESFQLCLLPKDDPRLKDMQPVSVVSAVAKAQSDQPAD